MLQTIHNNCSKDEDKEKFYNYVVHFLSEKLDASNNNLNKLDTLYFLKYVLNLKGSQQIDKGAQFILMSKILLKNELTELLTYMRDKSMGEQQSLVS